MTKRKIIRELSVTTTKQQMFDYVTAFLLKQGRPATDKSGQLVYRTPDGRHMCAYGCVIPKRFLKLRYFCDDPCRLIQHNVEDLEDELKCYHTVRVRLNQRQLNKVSALTEELQFWKTLKKFNSLLGALQNAHDEVFWGTSNEWRASMANRFMVIAARHRLQFDPELWYFF
jgi:hypothetical protein